MGADLYIRRLEKPVADEWRPKLDAAVEKRNQCERGSPEYAAAQAEVDIAYDKLYGGEHYFRDSYNGTSVLNRLGMSWWRDMEYDVPEPEDGAEREINVSAAACQRFLDKVLACELKPATFTEMKSRHCAVEETGENSVEAWNKYFAEKRERLIAFLKRAVENGGMYASC